MAHALVGAARTRGHPAHPARHLLPHRRVRRARSTACSCASATAPRRLGRARAALHAAYPAAADVRVGAAVHSVRAVPAEAIPLVARWAELHGAAPLHVHLSEQPAENEACLAAHGRTPTRLLADAGVLGPTTTAVHATHLTADDIELLGGSRTGICLCPTTERDLADGIGPARALLDAGSPLSLGRDSHAVIDLFEEARAVELDERLASRRRGHFDAATLLRSATSAGGTHWAGPTAAGSRRAPAPTWSRYDSTRCAPPAPGTARRPRCSPPAQPTSRTSWSAGSSSSKTACTVASRTSGGRWPTAIASGAAVSTLVTGIGELVTNDRAPRRRQPLGLRRGRRGRRGRRAGRLGRAGHRRARRRRARRRRGPGRRPRLRRQPRPPGVRRRPRRRVRGPDGRAAVRGRRHPHHRRGDPGRRRRRALARHARRLVAEMHRGRARRRSRSRAATG